MTGTMDKWFRILTTKLGGTYDRATHSLEAIGDNVASILGATGPGLRLLFNKSAGGNAERGTRKNFSIVLMDREVGAIPVADIDITGISVSFLKDTGTGFTTGPTAPTFAKTDGLVSADADFADGEWGEGSDSYKLVVGGIEVDIDGTTIAVPTAIWSGGVLEEGDTKAVVDSILSQAQTGFTTADGKLDRILEPTSLSDITKASQDIYTSENEITSAVQYTESAATRRVAAQIRATGLDGTGPATYTARMTLTRGGTTYRIFKDANIQRDTGETAFLAQATRDLIVEQNDVLRAYIQSDNANENSGVGIALEIFEVA